MEKEVINAVKAFAKSINPKSKVTFDMSSLIEATSKLPLKNFDYWERLIRYEFSEAKNESSSTNWFFKSKAKHSYILNWLDLISWDGHQRENTLRSISGAAPNTFFFILAVRRLNDWVPQVRNAARDKLPLMTAETDPQIVTDSLSIAISNWNSWGRIEDIDKQVILEIISKPETAKLLKTKIISSPSGPMSTLLSQLVRTNVFDEFLKEIAAQSIQPSVRAKAYRFLFENRVFWTVGSEWIWTDIKYCKGKKKAIVKERKLNQIVSIFDLMNKSSNDNSSIVRRISAEFLIQNIDTLGSQSMAFAKQFTKDKSPAVSERGKFAIKRIKDLNLN